jgi:hypothetical protein
VVAGLFSLRQVVETPPGAAVSSSVDHSSLELSLICWPKATRKRLPGMHYSSMGKVHVDAEFHARKVAEEGGGEAAPILDLMTDMDKFTLLLLGNHVTVRGRI